MPRRRANVLGIFGGPCGFREAVLIVFKRAVQRQATAAIRGSLTPESEFRFLVGHWGPGGHLGLPGLLLVVARCRRSRLGELWGDFEVTLESHWGHFETTLVSFWSRFGINLKLLWGN